MIGHILVLILAFRKRSCCIQIFINSKFSLCQETFVETVLHAVLQGQMEEVNKMLQKQREDTELMFRGFSATIASLSVQKPQPAHSDRDPSIELSPDNQSLQPQLSVTGLTNPQEQGMQEQGNT